MALTDKLTKIADAIRGKTMNVNELTLDTMVTEINNLTTAAENINLIKSPFIHGRKEDAGAIVFTDNENGTISIKGTKVETAAWCAWYFVNKIYEIGKLFFLLKRRALNSNTGYIIEVYNTRDEKVDQHWMYNGEGKSIDTSAYADYSYILYKVFITRVGEHDDLVRPICVREDIESDSFEDAFLAGTLTSYSNDKVAIMRDYAFYENRKLVKVNLPSLMEVPRDCFGNCTTLNDVKVPLATVVGINGFYDCSALTSLELPSVTVMQVAALNGCIKLKALILSANTVCILKHKFDGCYHISGAVHPTYNPNGAKDGYIYVPDELVDSYKTATNWSVYASQIKPLSEYVEE